MRPFTHVLKLQEVKVLDNCDCVWKYQWQLFGHKLQLPHHLIEHSINSYPFLKKFPLVCRVSDSHIINFTPVKLFGGEHGLTAFVLSNLRSWRGVLITVFANLKHCFLQHQQHDHILSCHWRMSWSVLRPTFWIRPYKGSTFKRAHQLFYPLLLLS